MSETITSECAIPAKLIFMGKEIDVTLVGHAYSETENVTNNGWITTRENITVEETFICFREYIKPIE